MGYSTTVVYLLSALFLELRAIRKFGEMDSCSTSAGEGAVFLLPSQAPEGGRKFSDAPIYKLVFGLDRYNFQRTAERLAY